MADNRRRRSSGSYPSSRRRPARRNPPHRREQYEFKPDPKGTAWLKQLYMTRLQRLEILKWTLHSLLCVLLLVIQDVIMSQIRISGATTDLAVCAILLIAIYEGSEQGGLFALLASIFYWFSGSAPGPYVIALICFLSIGIALFRQMFWHRSFGSTVLCTAIALIVYEMALFAIGIFLGLTIWARAGVYLLTGVMSCFVVAALYPLVKVISKIGGETWKE